MSSLGSLTVHAMRGTLQGTQKPVEVVTRAGVAGTGLVVGASIATPFQVETDFYGTISDCDTWRDTALGYVGTSQSVTDGDGATWSDVAILGMEFQRMRAIGLGGTSTHVVRATWRLAAEG